MIENATCKDSSSNTENFKFHCCVPSPRAESTIGDNAADGGECPDVVSCATNPRDCSTDANRADCEAYGCNVCADDYKKDTGHECTSCVDNFGVSYSDCDVQHVIRDWHEYLCLKNKKIIYFYIFLAYNSISKI